MHDVRGGFFTPDEIDQMTEQKKPAPLFEPGAPNCDACGLFKSCKSKRMPVSGNGEKKVLVIAEAPGSVEDDRNTQLVGDVGQYLRKKLAVRGIDLNRDCWLINAVNCRPPNNREPSTKELMYCKPWVHKVIEEKKPEFIWIFGGAAIKQWVGNRFKDKSATRWRGLVVPDKEFNAWVTLMYHPSYPMRRDKDRNLESTFNKDLNRAVSTLKYPHYDHRDDTQRIKILTDSSDIIKLLNRTLKCKPSWISHDYETTGLKPQRKGHRIVSISFYNPLDDKAYSFPLSYKGHFNQKEVSAIKKRWVKILEDPEIRLTSHNLKFEEMWSRVVLKCAPKGQLACTMINAHIIDNRAKYSGLKFQTFLHWGIAGYDKAIKPFLNANGANNFNKIDDAPLTKLLLYGALDSYYAGRLHLKQQKLFDRTPSLKRASEFFLEGLMALADVQMNGIHIDENYYQDEEERLTKEIDSYKKALLNGSEAKKFQKTYGYQIDLNGQNDLIKLFYEVLKYPKVHTNKGGLSTSQPTIEQWNTEFTKKLIRMRKLTKARDTYIAQFKRESVNGLMFPFFDLHVPLTYRGSASNPSFQNVPARDEEIKKSVRQGIKASPGNQLAEVDYSSIEVRVANFYAKDPRLTEYLNDPSTCMHRDQAMLLFFLTNSQITKKIRFYAKNCFVFPEFYGSYYVSCAKSLWAEVVLADIKTEEDIIVKQHLENKGIYNYKQFEDHVKNEEREFWRRFSTFKKWQENTQDFYVKYGYVEMLMGFRCRGYMTYNEVINYRIQGTAFHMLLWSLIEINKVLKRRGMKTKIIGQIHDSIIFDLFPKEREFVYRLCQYIMCEKIRKVFPWINVPLEIEPEETPIDGNWYEKEPVRPWPMAT